MSEKKYRMILLTVLLVIMGIVAVTYFYYWQQEKSYQDGTLVQNIYVLEEVAA